MMRRREFTAGLGRAAAWPVVARAQASVPVVAVLSGGGPNFINNNEGQEAEVETAVWRVFREGLNDAGYADGRNVSFEYSWANNQYDQLPALAAELVRRRVAVIVALGAPPAHAASAATDRKTRYGSCEERARGFVWDRSADHIRASGQTAALKGRIHDRTRTLR
jgi:putative tryptophan/tyrosine transport system substrate-binding protein